MSSTRRILGASAHLATAAVFAGALSGCSTLIDLDTDSRFFSPGSSGSTPVSAASVVAGSTVEDTSVGGVQYLLTSNGGRLVAYSGVLAGSDVGDVVTTGDAAFVANYEVAAFTDLRHNGSSVVGFAGTDDGVILLNADFDNGTLTGSSGNLEVFGEVDAGNLSGSVAYSGETGELDGIVGEFGTVGAFHGNSGTIVYAGGFVAFAP